MKSVVRVAAVVTVLVVAYVAAAFAIGRVIVSETARFSEALAAQPGVTVHRLDYEAGVFGGVLRYDFDYAPPPDSLLAVAEWSGVRNAQGEMVMRHGPWVDKAPALAAGKGRTEVPAALRRELPGLAADRALIETRVRIAFDRSVHATFTGLEHDGPLAPDGLPGARGSLRLAGITAQAGFDAALNWLDLELDVNTALLDVTAPLEDAARLALDGLRVRAELERVGAEWTGPVDIALAGFDFAAAAGDWRMADLSADAQLGVADTPHGPRPSLRGSFALKSFGLDARGEHPVLLRVTGLRGEADLVEDWPQMWTGTSSMHTGPLELTATGEALRWEQLSIESDTVRREALLDQTLSFGIGALQFDDARLGGARLVFSMNGIDGAALSHVVEVASRGATVPPQANEAEVQQALMQSAEIIFAGTPAVAIDHLGLSVLQEDDLRGRLALSLKPSAITPPNWMQLPERLQVEGDALLRLDAMNHLFRIVSAAELRGHDLSDSEVRRIADARFADWLQRMRELPHVAVDAEAVRTDIGYVDGMLTFNGQPVDPTMLLLMLALAGAALGS